MTRNAPDLENPPKQKRNVISVVNVGMGKMGRIRYSTIAENGNARVVAATDPDSERLAQLTNVRVHRTAADLIADPEVQAVFICTPNYLNQKLTIEALKAGKHVFCEKPPAFTAKEIEEVIAVEMRNGKKS